MTIIAQDPSVKVKRRHPDTGADEEVILTAQVEVPSEDLAPGPRGYRVQVIDYDSSTGILYPPVEYRVLESGRYNDPYAEEPDDILMNDPGFHSQNVYAIVMRTLARFEYALGRRVGWSFNGHQLLVAPHAFTEANAFYSASDRALLFGYFPKSSATLEGGRTPDMVFTCLSHDIIVHETTHALVDGLRQRFTDPSSPEQAGFHEGFADVMALLSIFSLPQVVERIVDKRFVESLPVAPTEDVRERISVHSLEIGALRESLLTGLAEEFGSELVGGRSGALRRSVELHPDPNLINHPDYEEPHKRGEILTAAMMNAFLQVWVNRLRSLGSKRGQGGTGKKSRSDEEAYQFLDRRRVVEEGAGIADYLLTMAIRALDYTPPADLEFCDFLSALLTADREIRPDDSRYHFREHLRKSFASYGVVPTSKGDGTEEGVWEPPGCELKYERVHLGSLFNDRDEMFRFIWENRLELGLEEDAYTRVLSVRPCVRANPDDGFVLNEAVAEYHQILNIRASELKHLGIKTPPGMPDSQQVTLYGGGALIFDEFGRVKFHIRNRLLNPLRQTRRLKYLWDYGAFGEQGDGSARRFADMHLRRFGETFPLEQEKFEDDHYTRDGKN